LQISPVVEMHGFEPRTS